MPTWTVCRPRRRSACGRGRDAGGLRARRPQPLRPPRGRGGDRGEHRRRDHRLERELPRDARAGVPDEQLLPSQGGERHRLADGVAVRVFPSLHACTWVLTDSGCGEEEHGHTGLTQDERAAVPGGLVERITERRRLVGRRRAAQSWSTSRPRPAAQRRRAAGVPHRDAGGIDLLPGHIRMLDGRARRDSRGCRDPRGVGARERRRRADPGLDGAVPRDGGEGAGRAEGRPRPPRQLDAARDARRFDMAPVRAQLATEAPWCDADRGVLPRAD